MADLSKYIRHPVYTTTGATAWFDDQRPLGAGRHQIILANNALHLTRENSLRTLAHHPGTTTLWRSYVTGTTGDPTPAQIDWMRLPGNGVLALDLGVHHAVAYGTDRRWPRLRCTFRWAPEDAGDTIGAVLVVIPAPTRPEPSAVGLRGAGTAFYSSDSYTGSTSFADGVLSIELSDAHLADLSTAPTAGYPPAAPPTLESGTRFAFRAFLGAYNSGNQDVGGRRASLVGISLYLQTPL